jgi:hypothetical protein
LFYIQNILFQYVRNFFNIQNMLFQYVRNLFSSKTCSSNM